MAEEILVACSEQIGVAEIYDEAGASQAVQMLRALRNKNIFAVCFLTKLKFDFSHVLEMYYQLMEVPSDRMSYFTPRIL